MKTFPESASGAAQGEHKGSGMFGFAGAHPVRSFRHSGEAGPSIPSIPEFVPAFPTPITGAVPREQLEVFAPGLGSDGANYGMSSFKVKLTASGAIKERTGKVLRTEDCPSSTFTHIQRLLHYSSSPAQGTAENPWGFHGKGWGGKFSSSAGRKIPPGRSFL